MRLIAIVALATGYVLGNLPAAVAGEWKRVLEVAAVIVLMAIAGRIGYHLGRATEKQKQIDSEEVDEHRALQAELAELTDPDPFNTSLRIPPVTRIDDTDTGDPQ